MISLASRLAGDFDSGSRSRGHQYYREGLVRIQYGSDSQLEARVRGSQNYLVTLDWDRGDLVGWCDCAYCESEGPCKHLWATILSADAQGYLSEAGPAEELLLESGVYDPDDDEDEEDWPHLKRKSTAFVAPPPAPKPPAWRRELDQIAAGCAALPAPWPAKREIIYIVDAAGSRSAGALLLSICSRDRKLDGTWTRHSAASIQRHQIAHLPEPEDREILAALAGVREEYAWSGMNHEPLRVTHCRVEHPLAARVVKIAAQAGRCFLQPGITSPELTSLAWEEGAPWRFGLEMRRDEKGRWRVHGSLRRGEERTDASAPALITPGGLVFAGSRAGLLGEDAPFEWIAYLRGNEAISAPAGDGEALLEALLKAPDAPPVDVPEELRYEEATPAPRPCVRIRAASPLAPKRLVAELSFEYEGRIVSAMDRAGGLYDAAARRFLRRDRTAEAKASEFLGGAGARFVTPSYTEPRWEIASTKLPTAVRKLVEAGWQIEAEGKIFRRPGAFRMGVASGIDWFELRGEVEYGETTAKLPALLEALKRGDNMVRLDDGSYGMLPEEFLRRFGMLAGMGTADTDHIRFRPSQAGLLDALLAAQPEAHCDETFARVRQELRRFHGVEAADQPAGFVGQLRDYQREGLGWMRFLSRFSFGGCLADDMGVGKTAQVLALLETRRAARAAGEPVPPSLVVVPKSLVFNWKEEAARFTPQLRVLDYTGAARAAADLAACDVALTTYGTLRRDAPRLKDIEFDYIVLDEAQAVKNAGAESSKAVRLLRGKHRLALSGTPIENHLGELWTLFEFLNPGMLGTASVFKLAGGNGRNPDEETRRLLAHAVRPFILRRTKEQVARELPAKTEQTIYCEMEPPQRKVYNELRQHYRNALLNRIETEGLAKSKIQVLEALLRLRQAACHPGLIDAGRAGEPSAKLDVLLEQLREVLDEGHKALVFSQFTSLLALVRARLEKEGVVYEYLDGATQDRQRRVERFQRDAGCPLFLISLKAGGLGLNLTAAEYVFLLDPWWNPAAEAQAVDRAHRIGQTKQVFAYRLIARDTVEEKVLELQNTKRDLAAAIIGEDNSLIRDLRREDLELLLS